MMRSSSPQFWSNEPAHHPNHYVGDHLRGDRADDPAEQERRVERMDQVKPICLCGSSSWRMNPNLVDAVFSGTSQPMSNEMFQIWCGDCGRIQFFSAKVWFE